MSNKHFTATVSPTRGRAALCVIFRHPVRTDRNGKPGLRIRRGLGTSDKTEAQGLVDQLNEILTDETMWRPSQRGAAAEKYDARIVGAFYDDLVPEVHDGWALRENEIPLPGPEQGFVRVKFLGTTGAGKTTLVRQLIGTDPEKERFPSISTARTTNCDIEIVMREGDFEAAVSFLPKDRVRQLVEESVSAAVMAHVEGRRLAEVARKLLEHREQRFRLSYMLGTLGNLAVGEEDDLLADEDDDSAELEAGEVDAHEKQRLQDCLQKYLEQIECLAKVATAELAAELEFDPQKASREEKDIFEELLEEHLSEETEFHDLVDQIMDDCESRFDELRNVELDRGRDKWPLLWNYNAGADAREDFLKEVNRFSSNFALNFGRLLTPMVEGIRVAGPFQPEWLDGETPRLVLLDGEGLDHTPASASSISTRITKRFELADTILLVDSAAQPMQAAPITVLNSLVASGHESKLAICFTHFDEVHGDNLPDAHAKRDHILGSLDNAIAAVAKSHGHLAETALKETVAERTVFLANIQELLKEKARGTRAQLRKLIEIFEASLKPLEPSDFEPRYDDANLILLVQQAMEEFREPWRARLKLPSTAAVAPEHWARIKALSRHISQRGADEYDGLRPVAEFIGRLQDHIARFLSHPAQWSPAEPPTEDLINQATATVRRHVHRRLHTFAHSRLIDTHLKDWSHAFSAHRGRGSTIDRAWEIEGIYNEAAPIPTGIAERNANTFLTEIRSLVSESIRDGGGRLITGKVLTLTDAD